MKRYLLKVKDLIQAFHSFDIQQILMVENAHVDALARLATYTLFDLHAQVFFEMVESLDQGANINIAA